jgi:hypothetical protein
MLSWVVTSRRTLRRSRKSHSHCVLAHSPCAASGGMDCARRASAPKSFPVISFTDPHSLTTIESYRYKNEGGQAAYHHPPKCHSSLANGLKPFLFILLRTLLHHAKSYLVYFQKLPHSLSKTTRGGGRSSFLQRSDVPAFDVQNDPPVPLRRAHLGATIGKGARNLQDPGKQLRSPRCLRIVSGHRGQLDPGPQCKSCLSQQGGSHSTHPARMLW